MERGASGRLIQVWDDGESFQPGSKKWRDNEQQGDEQISYPSHKKYSSKRDWQTTSSEINETSKGVTDVVSVLKHNKANSCERMRTDRNDKNVRRSTMREVTLPPGVRSESVTVVEGRHQE